MKFFFVSSIFFILIALNLQSISNEQLIPLLALFAVAGLRLMPSVTKISSSMQNLVRMSPFIDIIYDDYIRFLKLNNEMQKKDLSKFESKIEFKNVNFSFEKQTKKIFNNISFNVHKGDLVGLSGSSGSGKSTLADLIMGLINPTGGKIEIDGHSLNNFNLRSWQDKVGYVPQNIYIANDTIKNNIAFGIENSDIDHQKIQNAIKKAELQEFVSGSKEGLNLIIGEGGKNISGGQKQRIGIARALYHNPKVLILDESTSSLDSNTENNILNTVIKLKKEITTIIISHNENVLKDTDYIFKIQNGTIIQN